MQAELHTWGESREYVNAPALERLLPWQARGLSYSASGYGNKIPTRYMVQWRGRWRRVYCACYGNSGTCYIGKPGAWLATVESVD
jgi:hypothetical protein